MQNATDTINMWFSRSLLFFYFFAAAARRIMSLDEGSLVCGTYNMHIKSICHVIKLMR